MSSNAAQGPSSSKAVNIPNQSASTAFAPSVDSTSQRRAGGSGSFGAGLTSRNSSAPRHNQSRKSQHKRQRRPHLLDDEEYNESAIMRSTNSRKGQTSITHLMNFSLPPRPQNQPPLRNPRRYGSWGLGSGYHAMDKARYVHANYRFIVTPTRKYHAQAANADVHLDWDSVLQVLASAQTQSASCPICLSTPTAPRMARCGHIFCLPCLIRYMNAKDDDAPSPEKKARWKKCPICWDSVYISETRPVRWFTGQEGDLPVEGGDVVLRLVKRDPGSTLALPRDGAESLRPGEDIPWYHAAEIADYARIMKGGEDYMVSQYDTEIEDLRRQQVEDELLFGDETTWTQKAIAAINDAKKKIQGIGNPPDMTQPKAVTESDPAQLPSAEVATPVPASEPASGESSSIPNAEAVGHLDLRSEQKAKSSYIPNGTDSLTEAVGQLDLRSDQKAESSSAPSGTDSLTEALGQLDPDLRSDQKAKSKQRDPGTGRRSDRDRRRDGGEDRRSDRSKEPNPPKEANLPKETNSRKGTNPPHPPDHPFYFYQALPQSYLSPLDIRILKAAFGDYASFPATILPRVEHISTGLVDDELRKRVKYLGHLPQGCEVNFLECDWREVVVPEVLEQFRTETERRRKRNRDKEAREEKDRIRAEKEEDEKRWAAARRNRPSASTSISDAPFSDRDFQPLEAGSSSASPPQPSSHSGALASPSTSPPGVRTVWGTTAIASQSQPPMGAQPTPHDGWREGWEDELLAQQERELLAQSAAEAGTPSSSTGGKKKKNKKITLMSTNIQRGA